jgi:uncharacterized damage-inducible protein DinB
VHEVFLNYSIEKLRQCESRIAACLDTLTDDQIWWRGAESQNAIGNLVLHLCGNVGQWLLSGVGQKPDARNRDAEFQARANASRKELSDLLHGTIEDAAQVLAAVTPERMLDRVLRQGYDRTALEAIYHVVEHFSHHTGQIIYATKLLTQKDLGFYAHLANPAHSETVP